MDTFGKYFLLVFNFADRTIQPRICEIFTPQKNLTFKYTSTLEFRIDGTPGLLIIPFFAPSPTLFSTPRSLVLDNFASLPFIPDSPFINSCAQSAALAWRLGKATKLSDVHVFYFLLISMTFISMYRLRFGDFLSIC